jgi:hypothetical protein
MLAGQAGLVQNLLDKNECGSVKPELRTALLR